MVSQPVRKKPGTPVAPKRTERVAAAVARIERSAGMLWRADLPALTDAELKKEIAETWEREAESRDRRLAGS